MAITNVVAREDDNGYFKLYNWLEYYTRPWSRRKVGVIEYCYYPTYPFNIFEAQKANNFITKLVEKFEIKVNKVEYYIAENCDEIMRLKGFDYEIGMGDHITNLCGFCDRLNNIIYANAKGGEYYQHELVRLINNFFPKAHGMFINGLSEYFNESRTQLGLPFIEIFRRMDEYLLKNPDQDLCDIQSPFYTMDNVIAPHYMVGMIVCQLVIEKGGIKLLKKGMNCTGTDNDFLNFINDELEMTKTQLNSILRGRIHQYSSEEFPSPS